MMSAAQAEEPVLDENIEQLNALFVRLQKALSALKKHEQGRDKAEEDAKSKITRWLEETASLKADREQLRQQVKQLETRNQQLEKHIGQISSRLDAAIHKIGELID